MTSFRTTVNRRNFLKLGAVATGAVVGGCGQPEVSQSPESSPATVEVGYRPLGDTGLQVSEVAFGAHGIGRPDLMRAALDAGINTFCVSGNYLDGKEETALGEAMQALGGRREDVVIVTGNVIGPGMSLQRVLDDIDASLRRLGTDHIHVYVTSDLRSPEDLRVDALYEGFARARAAGKVGHLGLSGHAGGMQACLNAAIDDGQIEVFFIKFDFVSYPDQDAILHRAAERGIGTMVFKTHAGNRQHEIEDLEKGGLSLPQAAVKWALTNSYVASVAVSMPNFEVIRQYTAAASTALTTPEVAMLRRYADEIYDKYCRFCAECEAGCPHGVAVADINRYAMYFSAYGREKEAMRRYHALSEKCSAQACENCSGPCDAVCPFGRSVRAELLEAQRQLSFREA
jgi:aryl-alcohol dehydrogenase-like predicted oxidoreductase